MVKKYTVSELKKLQASSTEDEDKIYELAKELDVPGAASMDNSMLFSAVVAVLRQQGKLVETDDEIDQDDEDESDEEEEEDEVPQTVFVSYAPYSANHEVVGMTAREIIQKLQRPWSIENDPRAYLNGNQMSDDEIRTVRMEAGARLELAKKSSEKG